MKTQEKTVNAYSVIEKYLIANNAAKQAAGIVKEQKPVFLAAADAVAGAGVDQIQIGSALIYRVERKAWIYSDKIDKAQAQLDAAKKEYEQNHEPFSVTRCWAVKEGK